MSAWLDALKQALDNAADPVVVFFRDDDAGWQDPQLYRLLDVFALHRVALDIAVIPQALSETLAENLCQRVAANDLLALHQHGFSHSNHEYEGRKYEFGPSRSRAQQRYDLQAGKTRLEALLGKLLEPIFTPPWNRCTAQTICCLAELGFQIVSRDITAKPLPLPAGLVELPVSIDWSNHRNRLAAAATRTQPLGIMLHHAVMDKQDLDQVAALLALLNSHQQARCQRMRDVVQAKRITYQTLSCS